MSPALELVRIDDMIVVDGETLTASTAPNCSKFALLVEDCKPLLLIISAKRFIRMP